MIAASENIISMLSSPVRNIQAKVEFYEGSTLVETCYCSDRLKNFSIDRVGEESKFFGFGICQKMNVHLIDQKRELNFSTANSIKIYFEINGESISPFPTFHVSQVRRNEKTNELSITAYDKFYPDTAYHLLDIDIPSPFTLREVIEQSAQLIGASGIVIKNLNEGETCFDDSYETYNFAENEVLREVLNDVAEVTQTIYYLDNQDRLTFKRLNKDLVADFTINKSLYFDLNNSPNKKLKKIYNVTDLGDNIFVEIPASGSTQFVRNNGFWSSASGNLEELMNAAIAAVGGMTINQFDCAWRGNFLLEIGDKIDLIAHNFDIFTSYVLNDVIAYDGTFTQTDSWNYTENPDDSPEGAPVNIGDALKETYAKVDKLNHRIELVASEIDDVSEQIGSIIITSDEIKQEVSNIKDYTDSSIDSVIDNVNKISEKVSQSITSENIKFLIEQTLENGIDSITTSTGFTFDSEGLTIDKSGTEMKTQITEDGMTVYRDETAILTADHNGVDATNLRATTYLIIGDNSRFEDYMDDTRTGCFWIG